MFKLCKFFWLKQLCLKNNTYIRKYKTIIDYSHIMKIAKK